MTIDRALLAQIHKDFGGFDKLPPNFQKVSGIVGASNLLNCDWVHQEFRQMIDGKYKINAKLFFTSFEEGFGVMQRKTPKGRITLQHFTFRKEGSCDHKFELVKYVGRCHRLEKCAKCGTETVVDTTG